MPERHVFISYSKQDKDYVQQLVAHMESLGFTVWIDERIDPGKSWWSHIRVALRDCAAFIVVMTPASEESHWVDTEVIHALEFKKPIFPLLLAGNSNPILSDTWSRLARYQYYDVRGGSLPDNQFFESLQLSAPRKTSNNQDTDKTDIASDRNPDDKGGLLRLRMSSPTTESELGTLASFRLQPFDKSSVREPEISPERGEIAEQPETPFLEEARIDGPIEPVTRNGDWTPVIRTINGIEMVLVPPGCFLMGSEDGRDNEKPVHKRCIERPFWIGRHPVTNAQYNEAVKARVCKASEYPHNKRFNSPQQPVVGVNWHDAMNFANWKQIRLPTETEWEYATRGPESWEWPWGNDFKISNMVAVGNSSNKPSIIGSRKEGKSWAGALDLCGNVWEWCLSIGQKNYKFSENNHIDAPTPQRIVRGGSWFNLPTHARAASRSWGSASEWSYDLGFRLVCIAPISE